ncbi:MAG: AtpZ/AtpI family protein [Nitrospirae bacterium]|nr:AtpZ/AtpI family protein [Nitrospirota bacterium]
MNPDRKEEAETREEERFLARVAAHSRLLDRFRGKGIFWQSVAALGVVGWMIVLPAVAGTFLGRFLDRRFADSGSVSWTITFMLLGLALGIYSVWRFLFHGKHQ